LKTIAVIPARFAATRFHGKLMHKIGDKSIIRMVYENAVACGIFDDVLVVTDSSIIYNEIHSLGGFVIMSKEDHASGSDRIAEAIKDIEVDVVVNIQGDEPFISKEPLVDLLACFNDPTIQVASLMKKIGDDEDVNNPNMVKVVCNKSTEALYFSRSPIPFKRNQLSLVPFFKHIGVYAFKKKTLLEFTRWEQSILEKTEMLEQLRYLENGIKIKMVETTFSSIGIDTPKDFEKAKEYFNQLTRNKK
jgi:3-deoxy-manno-octulosonate cytidylyltransferase (CMP-KDO synthetase)